MTPEQIGTLVSSVGLPGVLVIVLLRWVLGKLNGKLDRLADAVEANTEVSERVAVGFEEHLRSQGAP